MGKHSYHAYFSEVPFGNLGLLQDNFGSLQIDPGLLLSDLGLLQVILSVSQNGHKFRICIKLQDMVIETLKKSTQADGDQVLF